MQTFSWFNRKVLMASLLTVSVTSAAFADGPDTKESMAARIKYLETQVAQLEANAKANDDENWLTAARTAQIKNIVEQTLADAQHRGQFADGPDVGYHNGFYIQTPDRDFKLVVGRYIQTRYEFAQSNAYNHRTLPSRSIGSGSSATSTTPGDPGNSNGFDIRRASVNFSGNIFSPNVTYKLEGDFEGSSSGAFTITDAFIGYRFTDLFKVKAGSFKVPFAREELVPATGMAFIERNEGLEPFNAVRSLGVSLYGDIMPDKLSYDIMVNNGSNSNTLRRDDTVGASANLDNRLGFYARMQYAGSGKISEFGDEPDLRKDNRDFVWMLGGAVGYESQNATNNAYPSPQTTATLLGLSSNDSPGFASSAPLNGDIFRATLDWSAKWQGLSLMTAAYFQQINENQGNTSSTSATSISFGPFGQSKTSFFEHSYYGQASYFVIPQKLELAGRAGLLFTEGGPNVGEFYSAGANYYIYGNNVKLQGDVTYTPEAAYTDSAESMLQNTQDLIFRVQLQLKF